MSVGVTTDQKQKQIFSLWQTKVEEKSLKEV
jgi:hypothetical protein